MDRQLPDYSNLRPPGGKRSSKRDLILNTFLRQEGHVSADDLYDLVRHEEPGIGRATVYRTLQWMVGAGIARKVDFGEGRSRFEPAYRHPRHFHLVCETCHRSSEFLSSDIEMLVEEVAEARRFAVDRTVVQIFGTCEECRTGIKTATIDGETTELGDTAESEDRSAATLKKPPRSSSWTWGPTSKSGLLSSPGLANVRRSADELRTQGSATPKKVDAGRAPYRAARYAAVPGARSRDPGRHDGERSTELAQMRQR